MTLSELKSKLIMSVKMYYSKRIYQSYPIWKQTNIVRLGGSDLATMSSFIDGKKAEIDTLELDINTLADTLIKDNFTTGSDASMCSYVASFLPNLTTDEQKLSVAVAIQSIR